MDKPPKNCHVRVRAIYSRGTGYTKLEDTEYPTPIALQIYSNHCQFCAEETPHFIAASRVFCGAVEFLRICIDQEDDEDEESTLKRYNVDGLPAIVVIKKGVMVRKHEGSMNTEEIILFVKRWST